MTLLGPLEAFDWAEFGAMGQEVCDCLVRLTIPDADDRQRALRFLSRTVETEGRLRQPVLHTVLHLACHPDVPDRLPLLTWSKMFVARYGMMREQLPVRIVELRDDDLKAEAVVLAASDRGHAR